MPSIQIVDLSEKANERLSVKKKRRKKNYNVFHPVEWVSNAYEAFPSISTKAKEIPVKENKSLSKVNMVSLPSEENYNDLQRHKSTTRIRK
jgi:hypothetical protein